MFNKKKSGDKIFGAKKGTLVVELQDTTFEVAPSLNVEDINISHIEEVDYSFMSQRIEEILEEFYPGEMENQSYTFKKSDINEIYKKARKTCKNYPIIEVISVMSNYLNIEIDRLYSFLGNAYKNEIIEELDKNTGMLEKHNIHQLF